MPWVDWLSEETVARLHELYPKLSYREMAVEAMGRPGHAERFGELDAAVETYSSDMYMAYLYDPKDFPAPYFPPENEKACARLVAAALLGDEPRRETPPPPKTRVRGSMEFPAAEYNLMVDLLKGGVDLREIERQTGIGRGRVARVRDRIVSPGRKGAKYAAEAVPFSNTVIVRRRS